MKLNYFRTISSSAAFIGGTIVATCAYAQPSQGGYGPGSGMGSGMMGDYGGGWMGGYGGIGLLLLVVVVVAGLVAWVVAQNKK